MSILVLASDAVTYLLPLCEIAVIGVWVKFVWTNAREVEQEQRALYEKLLSRLTTVEGLADALAQEVGREQRNLNTELRSRLLKVEALMRTLRRESTLNRAEIIRIDSWVGNVRRECRRARRAAEGGDTE